MTSSRTYAVTTLKEIRQNVVADSALFGDKLKPEAAMPESSGYSDLFMDAFSGHAEECGSVSGAADSDAASETEALETIRLGIEYIFEGYLLHYGKSRLLGPDDANFDLLAGDYMYARGLEAIARLEDLASVEALAELVRLCSFIHCEQLDESLAAKAWAVTTLGLAARISSGGAVLISGMPAFGELEELDARLEKLLTSDSLRERFSSIEAEFHGS